MVCSTNSQESALLTKVFSSATFVVDVCCFASTDFASVFFFFKILSPYPAVFETTLSGSLAKWTEFSSSFLKSAFCFEWSFASEHRAIIFSMCCFFSMDFEDVSIWLIKLPVTPILSPKSRTDKPSPLRQSRRYTPNIFRALCLMLLLCSIADR